MDATEPQNIRQMIEPVMLQIDVWLEEYEVAVESDTLSDPALALAASTLRSARDGLEQAVGFAEDRLIDMDILHQHIQDLKQQIAQGYRKLDA